MWRVELVTSCELLVIGSELEIHELEHELGDDSRGQPVKLESQREPLRISLSVGRAPRDVARRASTSFSCADLISEGGAPELSLTAAEAPLGTPRASEHGSPVALDDGFCCVGAR